MMAHALSLPFVGPMEIDADVVTRRTPFGCVAEWRGDERHGTAHVNGGTLWQAVEDPQPDLRYDAESRTLKFGGLRLRVLGIAICSSGAPMDVFYVKLDSPHAALFALYREKVFNFLDFCARLEAAVRVFRRLPVEDVEMPFTKRLMAKLL